MINKVKEVKWYDAVQKDLSDDLLKNINKFNSGKELLAINTSYGIVKKLKDVFIVIRETSTDSENECVIIPKQWVISIK